MSSVEKLVSTPSSLVDMPSKYTNNLADDVNTCTDECYIKCSEEGLEECFDTCNCKANTEQSIDALKEENLCLQSCSQDCVTMPGFDERLTCFASCTCKCGKFCREECESAGLMKACDIKCGCDDQELIEQPNLGEIEAVQETSEVQTLQATENDVDQVLIADEEKKPEPKTVIEAEITSIVDSLAAVDANIMSIGIIPETGFQVQDPENQPSLDEFQTLMEEDAEEVTCEPGCWRTCLQMEATKDQVFTCIQDCGCAYESPNLLLLEGDAFKNVEEQPYGFGFIILILILFLFLYSAATYIYKQECDNSKEDNYSEHDYEEGYERLD